MPCQEIDAGRFNDLLEVDAATNTRVEEMRELLDNAQYAPVVGRFKVYIIDEVHMLSKHAFNAMLKTLEEPPAHMKFILATTDPQKVPVTVLSRCLQFSLKPMTVDQLVSRIDHILQAEQVPFEPAALRLVARAAHGSVRDSLSVLDQAIAFGSGRVETDAVASLLGVGSDDAVLALAQGVAARDSRAVLEMLDRMIGAGQSAEDVLQDFGRLMQQVALLQLLPDGVAPGAGDPPPAEWLALAAALDAPSVQLCYQIALSGRRDLVHAPDEAAGLTMSFLRMLAFLPGGPAGPGGGSGGAAGGGGLSAASHGRASGGAPLARPAPPVSAARAQAPAIALQPLPDTGPQWLALVDQLPHAGTAMELARNVTWLHRSEQRLHLSLPVHHKLLLPAQERLLALLAALVGPVQIDIRLDSVVADAPRAVEHSVVARDDDLRERRQAAAETSIAQDPLVISLITDFGGRVVQGTVRPRDQAA